MPVIAALGGIDLIAVALVALILLVAFFPLFRPLLAGALSRIPVVGGAIASATDELLAAGLASAITWILQSLSPLADAIRRLRYALALWPEASVSAIEATALKLWQVRWQVLPALARQLEQYALSLFGAAELYALQLAEQGLRYAEQLAAQDAAYAQALAGQLLQELQLTAQAEAGYALQLAQLELSELRTVVQQLDTVIQAGDVASADYARQLLGEAIDYTRAAVAGAEAYAGQLGVDAEGYARALADLAFGHADAVGAQVAAGAAAATAVVAQAVQAIESSPCQQFCDPLGQVGGLIQALSDAGMAALLLAMAAELAQDPQGGAQAILGLLGDLVGGLVGDLGGAAGQAAGALSGLEQVGGLARAV